MWLQFHFTLVRYLPNLIRNKCMTTCFICRKKKVLHSRILNTVYGLRFLLKSEGLPMIFTLPEIKTKRNCPLYSLKKRCGKCFKRSHTTQTQNPYWFTLRCGLRCMEVRNVRLGDLDFDRKQLRVSASKGKKDHMCHYRYI